MKPNNTQLPFVAIMIAAAPLTLTVCASAQIIENKTTTAPFSYEGTPNVTAASTVSSTDLINSGQPSFGDTTPYNGIPDAGSIAGLNDGNNGGSVASFGGGSYGVQFDLVTTTNTLGYDLSQINVYSVNSDERLNQSWEIDYQVVGSSTYTALGNFTFEVANQTVNYGSPQWAELSVSNLSGKIATNVDSLRFTFFHPDFVPDQSGGVGDETIYAEIDVLGAPTAPEPSTYALLGGGALGLLLIARCKTVFSVKK